MWLFRVQDDELKKTQFELLSITWLSGSDDDDGGVCGGVGEQGMRIVIPLRMSPQTLGADCLGSSPSVT